MPTRRRRRCRQHSPPPAPHLLFLLRAQNPSPHFLKSVVSNPLPPFPRDHGAWSVGTRGGGGGAETQTQTHWRSDKVVNNISTVSFSLRVSAPFRASLSSSVHPSQLLPLSFIFPRRLLIHDHSSSCSRAKSPPSDASRDTPQTLNTSPLGVTTLALRVSTVRVRFVSCVRHSSDWIHPRTAMFHKTHRDVYCSTRSLGGGARV